MPVTSDSGVRRNYQEGNGTALMDSKDVQAAWREVQAACAGIDERGQYAVVPDEDELKTSANADLFARGLPPISHPLKRQYADGSCSREHAEADSARLAQARTRYEEARARQP